MDVARILLYCHGQVFPINDLMLAELKLGAQSINMLLPPDYDSINIDVNTKPTILTENQQLPKKYKGVFNIVYNVNCDNTSWGVSPYKFEVYTKPLFNNMIKALHPSKWCLILGFDIPDETTHHIIRQRQVSWKENVIDYINSQLKDRDFVMIDLGQTVLFRNRDIVTDQHGGGCRLCGAPRTNITTCPFNPNAKKPNPSKHNTDSQILTKQSVSAKTPTTIKIATTKKHGTTKRLSAAEYYAKYGPSAVGNVCDIRGDGELKCLLLRKNGVPYWANPSKSGAGQEACGLFSKNCSQQIGGKKELMKLHKPEPEPEPEPYVWPTTCSSNSDCAIYAGYICNPFCSRDKGCACRHHVTN